MSLHFLLDAYNIIYQIPSLAKGSLEEQRNAFIKFIDTRRPQGSLNNKVTIVFDGRAGVYARPQSRTAEVVFSHDNTADEKILKLVDDSSRRKQLVVVTDDRAVQYAVRALGAKVTNVKDFVKKGEPKLMRSSEGEKDTSSKEALPKPISKSEEHKITTELRSLWLRKDKDK